MNARGAWKQDYITNPAFGDVRFVYRLRGTITDRPGRSTHHCRFPLCIRAVRRVGVNYIQGCATGHFFGLLFVFSHGLHFYSFTI